MPNTKNKTKQNNLTEPNVTLMTDDLQRFFLEFRLCIDLYEITFFVHDIYNYARDTSPYLAKVSVYLAKKDSYKRRTPMLGQWG